MAPATDPGKRSAPASWSLRLAFMIAGLVYAASAAAGMLGATLLLGSWGTVVTPILGATLLLLCWVTRPRVANAPTYLLARAEYPALHALSDRLSAALGAPRVDGIGVSADFGANYRVATWRGRRYIELGAPLMGILTPAERIAVVAHELSHAVNGDPLRGQFLFGAVGTLSAWAVALRPLSIGQAGAGSALGPIVSVLAIPLELAMLAASETLFLLAKGVLLLVLRQSQRAEYLADRLAAHVAGTGPMQSALEKTYLHELVDIGLRTHALTKPEEPIGPVLRSLASSCSSDQLETYRVQSRDSNWQVDSTHPPTALRIDMLAASPCNVPAVLLTHEEEAALEGELDRMIASTQREMMNRHLSAIYG